MSIYTHSIDILIARYLGPAKKAEWYAGLAVYTCLFKSGQYFRSQADFWAFIRRSEEEMGLCLFEVARGPSGCFDSLINGSPKEFENGLHSYLDWSDVESFDRDGRSKPSFWSPPQEVHHLIDDRGSFISLEVLEIIAPGFPAATPAPAPSPAPSPAQPSSGDSEPVDSF